MNYYSLHHKSPNTSFKNAVIQGLAKDRGIYFPENITPLSKDFIANITEYTNHEIAYEAIKQFVGDEIPTKKLKEIIKETISFDFPLVKVDDNIASLELFHGPTMAFKDVGAKFMAQCLAYFNKGNEEEVTVLVATSGDISVGSGNVVKPALIITYLRSLICVSLPRCSSESSGNVLPISSLGNSSTCSFNTLFTILCKSFSFNLTIFFMTILDIFINIKNNVKICK